MNERSKRASRPAMLAMLAVTVVATLAIGSGSSSASPPSATKGSKPAPPRWVLEGSYKPSIDPANFVTTIDNQYFPLAPGTRYHYKGTSDGTRQTDDMVVTPRTTQILGVTCVIVRDTVSEHGRAIERTFDWYAQDKQGNVWYMGENSLERKNGKFVRASDSWKSGVDGAQPGIIMPGNPQPGDVYRQEYYPPGGALDQARVLSRTKKVKVADGTFKLPLSTIEWSPVEPQLEKKYYVAGIGEIEEHLVQGGHEQFELVSVTH